MISSSWYSFQLPNPAAPACWDSNKPYFGTGDMIATFQAKRNGETFDLKPCELILHQHIEMGETQWRFLNTWEYIYHLRATGISIEQVLLYSDGWYRLCICPVFHGLEYHSEIRTTWKPMGSPFWGQKGVMEQIGKEHRCNLFACYEAVKNLEEAKKHMDDPTLIRFDAVMEEIFGDG